MILNEEQLRFFYNEVLGEFEYSEEDEADGVDPLGYVLAGIKKMRKEINRLSGVSVSRWQSNAAQQSVHPIGGTCPVCEDNRLDGEPCPICESGAYPTSE
jgi:hypothetical protein